MADTDSEKKEGRAWITRQNFYYATALSALVQFGYVSTGKALLLEALIMIPFSGLFWGVIFTAFTRPYRHSTKESGKWGRAADQGDADAQDKLGVMHADVAGVPKNIAEAVSWFRKAAAQGLASAQYNLGTMYYNGEGVPKNDAEAVTWFRKAAVQGLASAQYNLGWMYANGEGVPKNDAEAVSWFRKAADQGDASAQFALGLMYNNGIGVPKNAAEAYFWWNLAATQGNETAKTNRDIIEKTMTREQIAEAQRRSAAWKPKTTRLNTA